MKFRIVLTTLFLLVILIVVTPTSILANQVHAYEVNDENLRYTLSLTANDLSQLTKKYIHVNKGDIVDLSELSNYKIIVNRAKSFCVNLDGAISAYSSTKQTVGDAFADAGIELHNRELNCSVTDRLVNGEVIELRSYDFITFKNDGVSGTSRYYTGETVQDFLKRQGIKVGKYDKLNKKPNVKLKANQNLEYWKAYKKSVTKTKDIAYSVKTKYDKNLSAGETKVTQKGVKGKREVRYEEFTYANGKVAHRKKVSEKIAKKPKCKIVSVGSKIRTSGRSSYGGLSVGQLISGRKTHYCACATCNGNGRGITASGKHIYNGMSDPHIVACNWLPLGAVISVDGVVYTVADTGGGGLSSVGRIDVFTPQGHAACYAKGTGGCKITILSL